MELAEDELGLRYQVRLDVVWRGLFSSLTTPPSRSVIPGLTLSNRSVSFLLSILFSLAEGNYRCGFFDFQVLERTTGWEKPIAG